MKSATRHPVRRSSRHTAARPSAAARAAATARPTVTTRAASTARAVGGDLLERIAELVRDGLLHADPLGRIVHANAEACRMLDCTGAWARGRPGSEVLRTAIPGEDLFADAPSGTVATRETLVLTRAGLELPARVAATRLSDRSVVLVLRDLTLEQRLQRELRQRERLATVGELAAGVAHEIRNPLAGISSAAQVLLTRFEPRDDRQKFCRVIIEQVDRLDRTVTSLLKFARPPEPQLKLARIEDVLERILTLEAERLSDARVTVERRLSARLPALYIDPALMEQVVLNLVQNAVQAMPEGGTLTLDVALASRREQGGERSRGRRGEDVAPGAASAAQGTSKASSPATSSAPSPAAPSPAIPIVRLRIIDTGLGIPREVLPRLFDPFFTTKPSGTGLGLSISQSIVQEHGGTISIASREGRGTTVVVELPLEKRHGQRRQDAR